MTDLVRALNNLGQRRFREYLMTGAGRGRGGPPFELLNDPNCSEAVTPSIEIERMPGGRHFEDRFEFGSYLRDKFAVLDRSKIHRWYDLWNWLALYYFDQLCPPTSEGVRELSAIEIYFLSAGMQYRLSFRHLVRAPWYAVCEHGDHSKVLLIHTDRGAPLATRGFIFEQLASRQYILSNHTVIAAAHRLYFDERHNHPRWGASGHGAGTVKRYPLVIQQLELTYDTRACSIEQLIALLPNEFKEWKKKAAQAELKLA